MKVKYIGSEDAVTVRHVTFEKGKAVDLSDDPRDAALAEKVLALPEFQEAKPGRPRKVTHGDDA